MITYKMKKFRVGLLGCWAAAAVLAGCGTSGTKTAEAMKLVQELKYDEALEGFDAAEEAGENARLIARGRGITYMGKTEYDKAIEIFTEALSSSSGFVQSVDYDMNYYLAAAYLKNGQPEEAEKIYDTILALRPGEEDAYFLRGGVRLELDDFEGAKEDFDKVVEMDSQNYDRLIHIHETLAHYGYREVGQGYLNDALTNAGSKMNQYDSGRIYYYLGEYQKACTALEKAREKGNADSFLYLGMAYEATGDYNYASSVYNAWIAKDTHSAAIYNQLAQCEMAMGNYQRALTAIQAGMQIEDSGLLQTLSFNEVVAYEYLGEFQKASALLDNYLKNYPDDEKAKREQIFLSTRGNIYD